MGVRVGFVRGLRTENLLVGLKPDPQFEMSGAYLRRFYFAPV